MGLFRRLLATLSQVERDLKHQGYIVVYGGSTSLLVPVDLCQECSPRRQRVAVHGLIFAVVEP